MSARCHAIASPSLSISDASKTSLPFVFVESSCTTFSFPSMILNSGSKSFFISTPNSFSGRSRTCPFEEITSYSPFRICCIVFAFAGDSTIIIFFIFPLPIYSFCVQPKASTGTFEDPSLQSIFSQPVRFLRLLQVSMRQVYQRNTSNRRSNLDRLF